MKQRIQTKPRSKLLFLLLLVLGCAAVLATGTYAAYTSSDSVKRVVAARTQNELRFSSNRLDAYPCEFGNGYAVRSITVPSSKDPVIDITVCNYPHNKPTLINPSQINYTMTVSSPDNSVTLDKSTGVLHAGTKTENKHILTIPKESVAAVSGGYITVVVSPDSDSTAAVDGYILAARLKIVPSTEGSSAWKGEIRLDGSKYSENDAINYHIHGTEECDMVLSWGEKVELGKWSKESLYVKSETGHSVTIRVGGPGQPTSYYLQFYRLAPAEANETADSFEISFTKAS